MVAAIMTGIVDIINAIVVGGWLFLVVAAVCFFLLYFLGFSNEQRNKTNELVIKVIDRVTREKENQNDGIDVRIRRGCGA